MKHAPVAQRSEYRFPKSGVGGSSPPERFKGKIRFGLVRLGDVGFGMVGDL